MNAFDLGGRTALITGGGGVFGQSFARCLAEAGARVAVLGRTRPTLDAAAEQVRAAGRDAKVLAADVLDRDALEAARDELERDWAPPDVLVHCAGGNLPGATIGPDASFFDLSFADFERVVDLNLHGTVLPTLVFGASMARARAGSIVTVSSMAAERPLSRVVGYGAAKAALASFTRWLAVELARTAGDRSSVRVNALAPGFFVTEQNRRLLLEADGSPTERGQQVLAHTPAGRFGEPEDLHGALLWLCSDASRFVTGAVVPVDGGFSSWSGV